jgi:hypothetical protein
LLVAGDIAVAAEADAALREVRRVFRNGPIVVTLGNHDFWGAGARGCRTPTEAVERFWQQPAQRYGVTLLDQENFSFGELTFVGGYGHYDLGFAVPNLCYQGKLVTRSHYLRGRPPIQTPLRWRDFDWMPGAEDVLGIARAQVEAVQSKISASGRIFVALHTPPFEELLGTPDVSGIDPENPPMRAFFRAYLGNRSMGEMLRPYSSRIAGLVCGHTHRAVGPTELFGFSAINVGSDYGAPRGLIIETEGEQTAIRAIAELAA